MSLIRNGGFESGDMRFWSLDGSGTFEISDLLPKSGVYCSKFTADAAASRNMVHSDYIPVNSGGLVAVSGFFKTTAMKDVSVLIYLYDSDYSFINTVYGNTRLSDGTWLGIKGDFYIPTGVSYIRVGYRIRNAVIGTVLYADSIDAIVYSKSETIHGEETLFDESGITSSGNSLDNMIDMKGYSQFIADLEVESVAGTNPTLDVSIYEKTVGNEEVVLGTFAQAIAAVDERIVLTNVTGNHLYIKYIIGGTNPSFNFNVYVVGKG